MPRPSARRLVGVAAALLLLPACAGDDGDGAALSRDAWRERAEARCASARSALAAAARLEDPVAKAGAQAEAVRALTADLRELEPPAGDRDAIREALDVLDGAADLAEQGVEARRADDEAELGRLREQLEELQERGGAVASASASYGLNDCTAGAG